ncbi:hypothetical protein M413DRAFT_438515 [Hebeloma cylindrosporum]|uniref:BRCT domain-containing protein n=1 Tax=Hebeloma cylindrosporum TaxID=76867 RepID=A0A0C3CKV5_HEBCY|nr:hypothetical protein M413DRAFT_438515 [Hebeloma cylindrosporum h7]
MDAFEGSNQTGSQATQLLQDLLENDSGSSKMHGHSSAFKPQPHEISSDSLPSSRTSNSLPQYHFHGLASTQTQSQHYVEEEGLNEGSQKENIGAGKSSKEWANPQPIPRPNSPHPPVASAKGDSRGNSLPRNDKGKGKKAATVTFQSPRTKGGPTASASKPVTRQTPYNPTPQGPSRFHLPRPPSRSSSQDSFACDPDNAQEAFLAKSEQFVVPLSELGRDFSSLRGSPSAIGGTSSRSMYVNSTSGRPSPRSPSTGRVLVEATPSGSSQSQSQDEPPGFSQRLQDTQLVDPPGPENQRGTDDLDMVVDKDFGGYESSEPSSSLYRSGPREPEPEMEATQPSTQPEDSNMVDAEAHDLFSNIISTGGGTSHSKSGPPLLTLVPPAQRHRYLNITNNRPLGPVIPSAQETQPSFDVDIEIPPGKSLGHSLAASIMSSRPAFPVKPSPQPPSPVGFPDVVPDSEPMRKDFSPAKKATKTPIVTHEKYPGSDDQDVETDTAMKDLIEAAGSMDDEDEEDIPLATVSRKRGRPPGKKSANKGRAKASKQLVQEAVSPAEVAANAPANSVQKPTTSSRTRRPLLQSWETGVVPSSLPEQDIVDNNRNRSTRSTNPKNSQVKPKAKNQGVDFGKGNKNDNTHLAGGEYQEDEDDEADNEPGPSHKRKRASSIKPAVGTKELRPTKRLKKPTATPATRQAKSLRSAISTGEPSHGTRVFALWPQDGHYYPGTVHSVDNNSRYLVHFDDDTNATLPLSQIRSCQFNAGDDVMFGESSRPARVVEVGDADQGFVKVSRDDHIESVPISLLRVAHKTILCAWKDRILTPNSVTTTIPPVRAGLSPSPSKMSMLSVPSMRGGRKKVLAKTGLIVTLTATNGNWEKEKVKVMDAVRNSGGFVIDDLDTILQMDGKHSNNNRRCIIKKNDVKWTGHEDIERLFLLADDPNQKPKYLIALALGIPCLSTSWLHDSVDSNEEKEWLGYMLPQGFSPVLNARPSQQVDIDWGNSIHQLKDIMSNTVASKLFERKTILCVGPGMVSQPKGRRRAGVDDKGQEAMNAVPRIILAMGADAVEAVTEPRYATRKLSDYDYVVIRDANLYGPEFSNCVTVHWSWVKECLIASRFIPLPSWPMAHSQEA